ncbi:MAG: O-antigen ligase family protein, partial [bacterium]
MKDPRDIVSVLLLAVLAFRPHLSGAAFPFSQELLLIPLLIALGLLLISSQGPAVRKMDLGHLSCPWLLGAWTLITVLWSPDPGQGVRDCVTLFLNLSAFTVVYLLVRDSNRVDRHAAWLSGLVILPVLTAALYQKMFGLAGIEAMLADMAARGEDVSGLTGVISGGRVFAGFLNANMLAGFLVVALPLSLDCALKAPERRGALLYWLLVCGQGTVLLLTGSMGGTLAAALACAGVVVVRRGVKGRELLALALVAGILGAGLLAVRGLDPIFGPESSVSQRAGYVAAGVGMALERPLLGWGAGSSPGALMGYVARGVRPVTDPHNFHVRIWMETGIPGLALLGCFLLGLSRCILRQVRGGGLKGSPRGYAGLLFASAGFLFHGLVDMGFFVPETALFGWCAMGALLAMSTAGVRDGTEGDMPLFLRQTAGGIALFAVIPALVLLQGENLAFRGLKASQSGQYRSAAELYREAGRFLPFNGRVAL